MNKLSVVIPAYNEEGSIKKGSLKEVWDFLNKQKYDWEIIVVDDGSVDKTLTLSRAFVKSHKNITVLPEPHRGKGGSVIAGMLKTTGDIVLFTDMDQATPIEEFEKLNTKLKEQDDKISQLESEQVLKSFGIDKLTEGAVKATVRVDSRVVKASEDYLEAKKNEMILSGVKEAFNHRKMALENEVKLFLAGYFSNPVIKKENKDDFQEMHRQSVNNELKKNKRLIKLRDKQKGDKE